MSYQTLNLRRVAIVNADMIYCLKCSNSLWGERLTTRVLEAGPKASVEDNMRDMGRLSMLTATASARCCVCAHHIR